MHEGREETSTEALEDLDHLEQVNEGAPRGGRLLDVLSGKEGETRFSTVDVTSVRGGTSNLPIVSQEEAPENGTSEAGGTEEGLEVTRGGGENPRILLLMTNF